MVLPGRVNNTQRKFTRRSAQTMPVSQAEVTLEAGLMWQVTKGVRCGSRACRRKKAIGEPYEGKPHVRFEVAGGGNRDTAVMIEALPKETGSNQAVKPKS